MSRLRAVMIELVKICLRPKIQRSSAQPFLDSARSESFAKTSKSTRIAQRVGHRSHASQILLGARGGNVRASREKKRQKRMRRHCNTEREPTQTEKEISIDIDSTLMRIGDMAPPKKSDKVRKLVPLKVHYEELQPFRRELSELHLDFLLWN